jgi:peptide-methionine (R)-S-oxide reductase
MLTPPDPLTEKEPPLRSASGHDLTPPSADERLRLAAALSTDERRVILHQGTEPPFCGGLLHNTVRGAYHCRLCGLPLFRSGAKFDSGTGWPSFFEPYDPAHVATRRDKSHGMVRDEIVCARCGGHLGHVFPDGPAPTGLRYCLNSLALRFVPDLPAQE